ncbi:MAG: hypothetical protein DRI39_08215 [Chloroflexi bacterium]|nr:MAG: hypothetical protein DRI39_08215 [Chloroflexota bacterium]
MATQREDRQGFATVPRHAAQARALNADIRQPIHSMKAYGHRDDRLTRQPLPWVMRRLRERCYAATRFQATMSICGTRQFAQGGLCLDEQDYLCALADHLPALAGCLSTPAFQSA